MKKILDRHVREALHTHLRKGFVEEDSVVMDELVVPSVRGRIDVVVVKADLHGFEIKSDADNLSRLRLELRNYGKVMDYLTAVVTRKHLAGARRILPKFWGIQIFEQDSIMVERESQRVVDQNLKSLAGLLWRDQALALLSSCGGDKGLLSKPKRDIHQRVVEMFDVPQPFGPIIPAMPSPWNFSSVRSQNDLKPRICSFFSFSNCYSSAPFLGTAVGSHP